jgi:hypothetical protein
MNPKYDTLRWDQHSDNTKNKSKKRENSFKISLPEPILLGRGKMISNL